MLSANQKMNRLPSVAVVGAGPSGLMAATVLSSKGFKVTVLDKHQAIGRKILIAGSTGLNISNDLNVENFLKFITTDASQEQISSPLLSFFCKDWLNFLQDGLAEKTFLGTSGRYFVEEMHAANLISSWKALLVKYGVSFLFQHEWCDIVAHKNGLTLTFINQKEKQCFEFDYVIFALGGASWVDEELKWIEVFKKLDITVAPFLASNVGLHVEGWSDALVNEVEGLSIKDCELSTSKGSKRGDIVLTKYGIEGTPVYHVGVPGLAYIDFFPQKSSEEVRVIFKNIKASENLHPLRKLKRLSTISPACHALFFHLLGMDKVGNLDLLVNFVKKFPLLLTTPRPLKEAISSSGGVRFSNLNEKLQWKKDTRVYFAGEMLNWDAPTGGFLIQMCVSQGHYVAKNLYEDFEKDFRN